MLSFGGFSRGGGGCIFLFYCFGLFFYFLFLLVGDIFVCLSSFIFVIVCLELFFFCVFFYSSCCLFVCLLFCLFVLFLVNSNPKGSGYEKLSKAACQAYCQTGFNEMKGRKEGTVLFNDALNTFYLWLYGVRHMLKNHLDREKGNPLPPHMLLFSISSKGSFICTSSQTG